MSDDDGDSVMTTPDDVETPSTPTNPTTVQGLSIHPSSELSPPNSQPSSMRGGGALRASGSNGSPTREINENGKRVLESTMRGGGNTVGTLTPSNELRPITNEASTSSTTNNASTASTGTTANGSSNGQAKTHKPSGYTWTVPEMEPGYTWRGKKNQEDMARATDNVVDKQSFIGRRYGDILSDRDTKMKD
ncbi:hypothetical protein K402DRAFT_395493 [Aulographum hederae CBS 113979]|uniref:Uncharacterized protein n=1 Tax=Aulographum hederae CBS 113979 TaxID=1176131 RepID=A0A6G1GVG2_9PEZI|nr:hypothetical protein K402DRAFT_395493 [Aulographum hederae CBS 113979]